MEQDDGFGFGIGSMTEVVDVSIRSEAADDGGAWWCGDGVALVADADTGLLAPDVGPPRALGDRADDRAFIGEGLLVGGVRGLAEFAMGFMLVGVGDELVEELVGSGDISTMCSAASRGTRRFCQ